MEVTLKRIEIHRAKGERPVRVPSAEAVLCGGLRGDRHCYDDRKQISITGADVYEWMDSLDTKGVCFQKFGANLVFDRIPDEMLENGLRLQIGGSVLEIQEVHKKCHVGDCVYFSNEQIAGCRLRRYVMYGEFLSGGDISEGDKVTMLESRGRNSRRRTDLALTPAGRALQMFMKAAAEAVQPQAERISAADALGRIAASDARAVFSRPHYDAAAMDGIAVESGALRGAAPDSPVFLSQTDFEYVNTGNPVEPPYDAVIMAEEISETLDGRVCIKHEAEPGQHVRRTGENITAGEIIVRKGHRITPFDIAALIEGGVFEADVFKRPRAAIFPTGDEVVEPEDAVTADGALRRGEIIDANSRMFSAMVKEQGGEPHRFPILPDDYDSIKSAVEAAAKEYDVIIINAGTSAGLKDYTVSVLNELGRVIVHGVAIKPGKPCILAVACGKPVIGLPGYPVAAYIGFREFVAPLLRYLQGLPASPAGAYKKIKAVLAADISSSKKQSEFIRVRLIRSFSGIVLAKPLAKGSGSAMLLVKADGFCIVPQLCREIPAGTEVEVILYKQQGELLCET